MTRGVETQPFRVPLWDITPGFHGTTDSRQREVDRASCVILLTTPL